MKHSYKLALLYLFTSVVMSACPGSEKKSVARIPYEKRSPQDKPNEVPSKEPNRTEGNEISQESLEGEPSTLDNSKDQTTEKDQTTQEDDPEGPSNNQDEEKQPPSQSEQKGPTNEKDTETEETNEKDTKEKRGCFIGAWGRQRQ